MSRCALRAVGRRTVAGVLSLVVGLVGLAIATDAAPAAAGPLEEAACPPGVVPPSGLQDVAAGSDDIDCLVWWGVTSGTTATTYGPSEPVTRGQMAAFLARLIARAGGSLPEGPPSVFWDTWASPHQLAIDQLNELGVVGGHPDGSYRPSGLVRRDQMASFLVRAVELLLGAPLPAGPDAFEDDDGSVHHAAIDRAASAGIVAGRPDGTYAPSALVTRRQMASFLVRALGVVVDGRAGLLEVHTLGLGGAAPTEPLTIRDGRSARTVPVFGVMAILRDHPVEIFPPAVWSAAGLQLPVASPIDVEIGAGHHDLSIDYVAGDGSLATPDPSNAAAIGAYFERWFGEDEQQQPTGWNGSVAACNAGTTSAAFRSSVVDAVNAARGLVSLPSVTEDATMTAKAQEAALLMSANQQLSHAPPSSWTCWTAEGADGAGHSNLYLGLHGVATIAGYLEDPGSNNTFVGHRQWILDPHISAIGIGDIPDAAGLPSNALWVVPPTWEPVDAGPISWPAPGFFPEPLLGATGRWSLSLPEADLTQATVEVLIDGVAAPSAIQHAGGVVVFTVPDARLWDRVTVTVTAPSIDPEGSPLSHTWTTRLVPNG